MLRGLEIAAGFLIVGVILFDVFASVILPRPVGRRFRVMAHLTRFAWHPYRRAALALRDSNTREQILGAFAPIALVVNIAGWVLLLIFGYGLIFDGLRDSIQPHPPNLAASLYFAGVSLLTIGYGDYTARAVLPQFLTLFAAGSGVGVLAVGTTFLFSTSASFQRREVFVVATDPRAGSPPSGVQLLLNSAKLDLLDDLPRLFTQGQDWAAEVLDSHLAYAILAYFRSTHVDASWIGTLGALLDAAALVVTTIDGLPRGQAQIMLDVGTHAVGDLSKYFALDDDGEAMVERLEFDHARAELAAAGLRLIEAETAWAAFSAIRATYASALNRMAKFWASPPAQWVGDRSSRLEEHHVP